MDLFIAGTACDQPLDSNMTAARRSTSLHCWIDTCLHHSMCPLGLICLVILRNQEFVCPPYFSYGKAKHIGAISVGRDSTSAWSCLEDLAVIYIYMVLLCSFVLVYILHISALNTIFDLFDELDVLRGWNSSRRILSWIVGKLELVVRSHSLVWTGFI